jgi:hypothetical protein
MHTRARTRTQTQSRTRTPRHTNTHHPGLGLENERLCRGDAERPTTLLDEFFFPVGGLVGGALDCVELDVFGEHCRVGDNAGAVQGLELHIEFL